MKNSHLYPPKHNALACAVGLAITRWSNLESEIVYTCAWALGFDIKTMAPLLAHFQSFKLVLSFTDSAVKIKIGKDPSLKHWNSMVAYITELSGDRNFMAHNSICASMAGDPTTTDWANSIAKVGPNVIGLYANNARREPMDLNEVEELQKDFEHLITAYFDFFNALKSGDTLPEKFLKPVARRRAGIQERREQSRKGASVPPQSSRV